MKKIIYLIPAAMLLVILVGCATPLAGIKADPERYAGRYVTISAAVILEAPMPFMDYSLYRIEDDTDKMFLFTRKDYRIGETVTARVHVIGINDDNSRSSAERIAKRTSDFLVDNNIVPPEEALAFSKKLVRLISTLGNMAEGSYFLIAR